MARNKVAPEKSHWKQENQLGKVQKRSKFRTETNAGHSNKGAENFFVKAKKADTFKNFKAEDSSPISARHPDQKQSSNRNSNGQNNAAGSFFMTPVENTNGMDGSEKTQTATKKPFDKKSYRLRKYSKKYKVEQWEDKRKKAVLREYYRSVKDEPKSNASTVYEHYDSNSEDVEQNENNLNNDIGMAEQRTQSASMPKQETERVKPIKKAHDEFQRIKEEKQKKREEFLLKKVEKAEALKKLKKEKAEKYRKLSKRTKKGQPIMKDRMEMLLEKIQRMT